MEEIYVAPELKLVGEANEVILGLAAVGTDIDNQAQLLDMEFESD